MDFRLCWYCIVMPPLTAERKIKTLIALDFIMTTRIDKFIVHTLNQIEIWINKNNAKSLSCTGIYPIIIWMAYIEVCIFQIVGFIIHPFFFFFSLHLHLQGNSYSMDNPQQACSLDQGEQPLFYNFWKFDQKIFAFLSFSSESF